jgi:hypothetical protein
MDNYQEPVPLVRDREMALAVHHKRNHHLHLVTFCKDDFCLSLYDTVIFFDFNPQTHRFFLQYALLKIWGSQRAPEGPYSANKFLTWSFQYCTYTARKKSIKLRWGKRWREPLNRRVSREVPIPATSVLLAVSKSDSGTCYLQCMYTYVK